MGVNVRDSICPCVIVLEPEATSCTCFVLVSSPSVSSSKASLPAVIIFKHTAKQAEICFCILLP